MQALLIVDNHLFLLGNPFSTLRCHLDGRQGLVVAYPTEAKKNNVMLCSSNRDLDVNSIKMVTLNTPFC